MKKTKNHFTRLFIIIFLSLGIQLNAQVCPLQEAVDFTATDSRGNEIHLFDILDNGQAVFIHFFVNNNLCDILLPYITEAYSIMGCNTQDVYFMEISHRDSNIDCQRWADVHHIAYPTIGVEGGGEAITFDYGVQTSNVFILIMPDRSITIHGAQELYPFSTDDVVNALAQYGGLEPQPCTGPLFAVNDTVVVISNVIITPGRLELINLTDEDIVVNAFETNPEFQLHCFYNGVDVTDGSVNIASGRNATFEVYASLHPKSEQGRILIHTSAGDLETILIIRETLKTTEVNTTSLDLYPDPTSDRITIEGENLGSITILNLMGQKMDEFNTNGCLWSTSVAEYPDGVYVVKTSHGVTKCFIVKH